MAKGQAHGRIDSQPRAGTKEYHRLYRARLKAKNAAENVSLGITPVEKPKAGTPEYYQWYRAQKRSVTLYDVNDPLCQLRFVEAGRELAEMMNMPALDWAASKYAKEYGQ